MKELISIISELHAPKNKTNTFGKFNYRDAAGILEAVKPLLVKYNCLLCADTDVVLIGDRYYIKAIVEITNSEDHSVTATAFAREQDSKSGMDAAQLTGACISYAKKYALCNLFCIDDSSDDPDTDDATKKQKETTAPQTTAKAPNLPSAAPKSAPQATAPTAPQSTPKMDVYSDGVILTDADSLDFHFAVKEMREAQDVTALRVLWAKYKQFQNDERFTKIKNARKDYLSKK